MLIVRFRNKEDHEDLMMKVKKMRKYVTELEECLADAVEDNMEFRSGGYRKDYEDDKRMEGRYSYRRGM